MAADSTLVSGAYRASRDYSSRSNAAMKGLYDNLGKTGKSIDSSVSAKKEKDNKEAKDKAKAEAKKKAEQAKIKNKLDTEIQDKQSKQISDLNDQGEAMEKANKVKKEKEDNADKNAKEGITTTPNDNAETVASLSTYSDLLATYDDGSPNSIEVKNNYEKDRTAQEAFTVTLEDLSEDWSNRSSGNDTTSTGFGLGLQTDADANEFITDFINSDTKTQKREIKNDKGEVVGINTVVVGPDGEDMSLQEFDDYIDNFRVDNDSFNEIESYIGEQAESGFNLNQPFDEDGTKNQMLKIVNKGKINSLINDPNFGQSSYLEDLANGNELVGIRYSDLGLTNEEVGDDDGEIHGDENLSEELRLKIARKFIDTQEPDALKSNLADYFTEHAQRRYTKKLATKNPEGLKLPSQEEQKTNSVDDYLNMAN